MRPLHLAKPFLLLILVCSLIYLAFLGVGQGASILLSPTPTPTPPSTESRVTVAYSSLGGLWRYYSRRGEVYNLVITETREGVEFKAVPEKEIKKYLPTPTPRPTRFPGRPGGY